GTPTEQKIVDQLHQSPKDIHRTIYNTPTKPSVLKENQAEIHSHDVQTNDERPPLVNFLSCYVSLTQYQEDNSINIPAVNTPEDLELELQQSQKDNEILSLYNEDVTNSEHGLNLPNARECQETNKDDTNLHIVTDSFLYIADNLHVCLAISALAW
ncbi:unnamed protein product, partial [Rotaria magnacalcarata]